MPLRPAPMIGGPRQGPRCLFSIAWTAQYLHLSPGKQQAPTEVQGPMRNRKWVNHSARGRLNGARSQL